MLKIKEIINYSRENGGDYFTQIFSQRTVSSPMRAGSYYEVSSVNELIEKFENANGTEIMEMREPDYREPENTLKYKSYYRVPFKGLFGLINLQELLEDTVLVAKSTKEGTPKSLLISNPTLKDGSKFVPSVCESTLLVVSVDESNKSGFLLTLFPESGTTADTKPAEVMDFGNILSDNITVSEALKLGFKWAKVVE